MKTTLWALLALLVIPGCLLVQPLDDAKPEDDGTAATAGSSGQHSGGSNPGTGGAGNKAGSGSIPAGGAGPLPSGGAANGGAPSGVDFSLFTGSWTLTSGENTVTCGDQAPQTSAATPGTDTFGLGTVSDLIFNPGSDCEIWVDVDDHTASLNPATPNCTTSDADYDYDLYVESFDFVVSDDGKTAQAKANTSTLVSDSSGAVGVCDSTHTWNYKR